MSCLCFLTLPSVTGVSELTSVMWICILGGHLDSDPGDNCITESESELIASVEDTVPERSRICNTDPGWNPFLTLDFYRNLFIRSLVRIRILGPSGTGCAESGSRSLKKDLKC